MSLASGVGHSHKSPPATTVVYWWNIVFLVQMGNLLKSKKNTESDFIESVSFERLSDYLTFVRLQYPVYQHATAQSSISQQPRVRTQEPGHRGHVGLMRTINENLLAGVFLSRSPQLPRPCHILTHISPHQHCTVL